MSSENHSLANPLVAAAVSPDQVRFTALALTRKIRLEVLSQTGDLLYDSGFQPGNRLEWPVKDQQGSGLRDGVYGCLITVTDLYGQWTHRRAVFQLKDGVASFQDTANGERATAASNEQENLTVLRAGEESPFTFVSHDSKEGWVESASGGLSIYAGSLSRSRDSVPHLRLTPEGNLGIGVTEPEARLDVAGVIRASEGFQFSDGTILRMEGGLPVLVTESSNGNGGNSSGFGSEITRVVGIGDTLRVIHAGTGGRGMLDATEGGAPSFNTLYGLGTGVALTSGFNNSFFGWNAGLSNTGGFENSFFGYRAGSSNTTGMDNSFFGDTAGLSNTTGGGNSFFGRSAGWSNTEGVNNSFFGNAAGGQNTTGNYNSFYGWNAGVANTTGNNDSFFGFRAGFTNTTGHSNSFFGNDAGYSNTTGSNNAFFGQSAGSSNTTGFENSFVGYDAGLSNTTGYYNSFIGTYAGWNNTTGCCNSFLGYSAGPVNTTGGANSFFGLEAGFYNTTGGSNSFVGYLAGLNNTTGGANSFFGINAGASNTVENYNNAFGALSDVAAGVTNATVIGYRAQVTQSNSLVLGSINGVNYADADTNVGIGTSAPAGRLHVKTGSSDNLYVGPNSRIGIGTKTPDKSLQIVSTPAGYATLHIGGAGDETKDVYSGMGPNVDAGPAFNYGYSGSSFGRSSGFFNVRPDPSAVAPNPSLRFLTANQQRMIITNTGNVGIGTTNPAARLHVVGNLRIAGSIIYGAPEVEVPDYVFASGYKLMPLDELDQYLQQEKHLPNVPMAGDIKENGINLGEFQMKLLEKIEELTLYTVQQAKTISQKDSEISSLSARLAALEQAMERLTRQK